MTPPCIACATPFLTAGTYSLGMVPPRIASTKSSSPLASSFSSSGIGSKRIDTARVLPCAARLPPEGGIDFRSPRDCFAVSDPRPADSRFHAIFAHQAVDQNLQVQLAHAFDFGLAQLVVNFDLESGVFFRQLAQAHAHLVLVGFGVGLDGDFDDRIGEGDIFEQVSVCWARTMYRR